MSTKSPVPFASLTTLSRAVDEHLADRGILLRSSAFSLCIEAVAFGRESGDDPVASVRARSAAYLLLELFCPAVGEVERSALAEACGRATRRSR